jgi:hypothetical protein
MKNKLNRSSEIWMDEGKVFAHDGKLFQYQLEVLKVEGKPGHQVEVQSAIFVGIQRQIRFDLREALLRIVDEPKRPMLPQTRKIVAPPGCLLANFADFIFSKQKLDTVLLPVISDMCEEYFEALSQNRIWKARWVRVRGTWSFFAAIGLDRAFAFVSFFIKAWKSVS